MWRTIDFAKRNLSQWGQCTVPGHSTTAEDELSETSVGNIMVCGNEQQDFGGWCR